MSTVIVCENCREYTYKKFGVKSFYLSINKDGDLVAICTSCRHPTIYRLSASSAREGK